jgi:hypothetical protein
MISIDLYWRQVISNDFKQAQWISNSCERFQMISMDVNCSQASSSEPRPPILLLKFSWFYPYIYIYYIYICMLVTGGLPIMQIINTLQGESWNQISHGRGAWNDTGHQHSYGRWSSNQAGYIYVNMWGRQRETVLVEGRQPRSPLIQTCLDHIFKNIFQRTYEAPAWFQAVQAHWKDRILGQLLPLNSIAS